MKRENLFEYIGKYGTYLIVLILLIVGCIVSDKFLSVTNIINILDAVSYLGILASGMALVTYCGQSVDLSTPSTIAVASFVSILTLKFGMVPMIICTLLSGALLGLLNGLVIGKFRINTVVWTLAMSFVFAGLIRVIFGSANIYVTEGNVTAFEQISRYRLFGTVPLVVVVMLAIMILLHIFISRSRIGRQFKLVGCSEEVAKYSGINVLGIITLSFVGSGMAAALTGIFIASLSKAACYNYGSGYEFRAITAVVLSGMVLDEGRGSIAGVLGGVLAIGLLNNIMTLIGLNSFCRMW
ncbi:MAG: ABC transporter permease [Lachnospiraceae bacterium]|nr:ABC transporter permease [Lachnospiraceae bacterium]